MGKRRLTQAVREGLSDKVVFRQRPRGRGSRPCRSPEEVHLAEGGVFSEEQGSQWVWVTLSETEQGIQVVKRH